MTRTCGSRFTKIRDSVVSVEFVCHHIIFYHLRFKIIYEDSQIIYS